jgi:hypothetical protein
MYVFRVPGIFSILLYSFTNVCILQVTCTDSEKELETPTDDDNEWPWAGEGDETTNEDSRRVHVHVSSPRYVFSPCLYIYMIVLMFITYRTTYMTMTTSGKMSNEETTNGDDERGFDETRVSSPIYNNKKTQCPTLFRTSVGGGSRCRFCFLFSHDSAPHFCFLSFRAFSNRRSGPLQVATVAGRISRITGCLGHGGWGYLRTPA